MEGNGATHGRSVNATRPVNENAPLLNGAQGASTAGDGHWRRTVCLMLLGAAVVGVGIGFGLFGKHWVCTTDDDSGPGNVTENHLDATHSRVWHLRPEREPAARKQPPSKEPSTREPVSKEPASREPVSKEPASQREPPKAPSREDGFGTLIFHEDFSGSRLDDKVWNVERTMGGGGNWEFQYYCEDPNVLKVQDGTLIIQPGLFTDFGTVSTEVGEVDALDAMIGHCQPWPNCSTFHVPHCTNPEWLGCKRIGGDPTGNILNPVTSARINSRGKFSFKYGRLEFSARLPRGDYLWPALWLLPEDEVYGGWPASGEIDIMESRGNKPGYTVGGEQAGYNAFGSTLHYGNIETKGEESILLDGWRNAHAVTTHPDDKDFTTDFNIFGLYWDERMMYTYTVAADGREVMVLNLTAGYHQGFWEPPLGGAGDPMWFDNPYKEATSIAAPFDQAFYLIINLAVGGQEGNLGYWEGAPWAGCHQMDKPPCFTQGSFWEKRHLWLPSWEQARAEGRNALVIDSIKVWQHPRKR